MANLTQLPKDFLKRFIFINFAVNQKDMKYISNFFTLQKTVLLLLLAQLIGFTASANPGDTTWVTIYNNRKITQYGNYDTMATYPTGLTYRKIRLHYILGRYACP